MSQSMANLTRKSTAPVSTYGPRSMTRGCGHKSDRSGRMGAKSSARGGDGKSAYSTARPLRRQRRNQHWPVFARQEHRTGDAEEVIGGGSLSGAGQGVGRRRAGFDRVGRGGRPHG